MEPVRAQIADPTGNHLDRFILHGGSSAPAARMMFQVDRPRSLRSLAVGMGSHLVFLPGLGADSDTLYQRLGSRALWPLTSRSLLSLRGTDWGWPTSPVLARSTSPSPGAPDQAGGAPDRSFFLEGEVQQPGGCRRDSEHVSSGGHEAGIHTPTILGRSADDTVRCQVDVNCDPSSTGMIESQRLAHSCAPRVVRSPPSVVWRGSPASGKRGRAATHRESLCCPHDCHSATRDV